MKRIEIYINSRNNLTIDLFKRYEDEFVYKTYKGKDAYELIGNLMSQKINDIVPNKERDNILLEYEDYIVILNEPDILLKRNDLCFIINIINKFYEENSKKDLKNKKVTRKNKHTGKKIIAAGLVAMTLFTIGCNLSQKQNLKNLENSVQLVQQEEIVDQENVIANNEDKVVYQENEIIDLCINPTREEESTESIFVDYGDRSTTEKAYITKVYYGDLIEKYARQYGLDPTLVLGIATQERGIHSEKKILVEQPV